MRTSPIQFRLTEADKTAIRLIQERLTMPTMADAVRAAVHYYAREICTPKKKSRKGA